MEESSSDKIHKTFKDDLLSNISEAKNDCLDTPEWLAKSFSLPANLELANTLARIGTSQTIASPNSTFIELATSGISTASPINLGLEPFAGIDSNLFSSAILATTGSSLVQSALDQTIENLSSTSIGIIPQISTEFAPSNNIHEELSEHEKRIRSLEEKDKIPKPKTNLKLVNQVKKLSKKIDDVRNDTHDSIEYMAKQFDILAKDVDVLAALVEDDED